MIIGLCNNKASVVDIELVIILRACELCALKADAELKALNGRDTEDELSYGIFKSVKNR